MKQDKTMKTLNKNKEKHILIKEIANAIESLSQTDIAKLLAGKKIRLSDLNDFELSPEDVIIHRFPKEGLTAATDGDITVALDETLTQDLIAEGIAREFISKVQSLRKKSNLDIMDHISIIVSTDTNTANCLNAHINLIKNETLTDKLEITDKTIDGLFLDLNGHKAIISIK